MNVKHHAALTLVISTLLVLVLGFVLLYLGPVMNASVDGVVHEYMHTVATTAPSYNTAKEISERLHVQARYEGPDGAWATAADLPTIAEARRHDRGSFTGRHYYVASAPNGGTYLFAWTLSDRMRTAHLVVVRRNRLRRPGNDLPTSYLNQAMEENRSGLPANSLGQGLA